MVFGIWPLDFGHTIQYRSIQDNKKVDADQLRPDCAWDSFRGAQYAMLSALFQYNIHSMLP
jgi:hypothetical protein